MKDQQKNNMRKNNESFNYVRFIATSERHAEYFASY